MLAKHLVCSTSSPGPLGWCRPPHLSQSPDLRSAMRLTDSDLSRLQHKAAKKLPESTDSRAAQLLLDKLCALYYKKKAKYTDSQRYEKLRYDMLIAAIDAALPEHSSAMVYTHSTLSDTQELYTCSQTLAQARCSQSFVVTCSLLHVVHQVGVCLGYFWHVYCHARYHIKPNGCTHQVHIC